MSGKNYGLVLQEIAIIPIILSAQFASEKKERRLVQKAQKSADYRLFIDFEEFLSGTREKRIQLLVENILTAVQDIDRKLKGQFAGTQLCSDIRTLFPESTVAC